MSEELIRLTASEVVAKLIRRDITPLEAVDAAAARIEAVEPALNALPTLCLDRAREHAARLMRGEGCEAQGEPGWLGGLPIAIKDLADVAGVRTTYGSPIYKDHVPLRSHPLVTRIERKGGIVIGKSNTPEFGAGGSTFNPVFGRTRNPWNTALTSGGSTGGGAAALASGEVWLAHGTDHGGSLRQPASYCSVVGLRPSPGRVTRGSTDNLWSPLSLHGPMARNVPDLALFLDTMAGFCRHDPMTFDAPSQSFTQAVREARRPARIAWSPDYGGRSTIDAETRDICARAALRFGELGTEVEEDAPDPGELHEAFVRLRSQHFVVAREQLIERHRESVKPDIIWNTQIGLDQSASALAWAERERAAFYRRMNAFFETYDLLVTPCTSTPAFDVMRAFPEFIDGKPVENYLGALNPTEVFSLAGLPAISVPCGFDRHGRPVGLQIAGPPRSEAAILQAAALLEQLVGLDSLVPIVPREGQVPPASAVA